MMLSMGAATVIELSDTTRLTQYGYKIPGALTLACILACLLLGGFAFADDGSADTSRVDQARVDNGRKVSALAYQGFLPLPSLGIEAHDLMDLLLQQKQSLPERVTEAELETVARNIESYYRDKGIDFVEVRVSERSSRSGVVWLQVIDKRKKSSRTTAAKTITKTSASAAALAPVIEPSRPMSTPAVKPRVKSEVATSAETATTEPTNTEPAVTETTITEPAITETTKAKSILSTPREARVLVEVTNFDLSRLTQETHQGIDAEQLESIAANIREQLPPRVSLEDLYSVSDALTGAFRDAGFRFHSVYLPVQRMRPGDPVVFDLLIGKLGDVHVRGEEDALHAWLASEFGHLIGRPLYQPDIDHIVLALQSQRGLKMLSFYSRGSGSGEVRLNLKVKRDSGWSALFRLDNFGNESTGRDRLTINLETRDLATYFDQLSIGVQQVVDGETNTYGSLSYRVPLGSLDHWLGLSVSNNQFELGDSFESLELEGDARVASLNYSWVPVRSFQQTQRLSLEISDKNNDYDSPFNDPILEQDEESQSASLAWTWQYRPLAGAWQYAMQLGLASGQFEQASVPSEQTFTKGRFSQQLELAFGDAASRWWSSLRWSLRGQYAEHNLPSFEAFSMTGAYGVRGFKAGYFSAERGGISSVEWWFPGLFKLGESFRLTPFLFIEGGYGERLTSADMPDTRVALASSGLGLQFTYLDYLSLSLSAGSSLDENVYENPDPETNSLLVRLDLRVP